MTDQPWMLNEKGNVILAPCTGYTVAIFHGSGIGLRLEFARSDEQLQSASREAEQLILSPQFALELGKALVQRATSAMELAPPDATKH